VSAVQSATAVASRPDSLSRPGSFSRAVWLYMSTTALVWAMWALLWLTSVWGQDLTSNDLGTGIWLLEFVVVTVLVFLLNALFWMPLAWLIDANSPTWPWYLGLGIVFGAWIPFALGTGPMLARVAESAILIGGFVVGPMLAQKTFRSRRWRTAVTVVIVAALASVAWVLFE